MSKEWAESVGITAVLYVSNNSHIYKSFRELLEKASQLDVELQEDAKKLSDIYSRMQNPQQEIWQVLLILQR